MTVSRVFSIQMIFNVAFQNKEFFYKSGQTGMMVLGLNPTFVNVTGQE